MIAEKLILRVRCSLCRATRLAMALLPSMALVANSLMIPAQGAGTDSQTTGLSQDQQIIHVLNRLGYGARPGDVERVRQMGFHRYIEIQLHPDKIDDSAMEARLREFPTLAMSIPELYAKYPQPAMLVRRLEQNGQLPPELQSLAKNGGQNVGTDQGALASKPAGAANSNADAQSGGNKDRQALRDYYMRNNLQFPARITVELQASRIERAVYSERQLQEVMVDFWTNHFNVYAEKGADKWFLTSYDRDVIRPHAMGNFQDLLVATAESPAMLFYLDNFQSVSPNRPANQRQQHLLRNVRLGTRLPGWGGRLPLGNAPPGNSGATAGQQQKAPKRGINENYARELMELHTLGVDGGYTQKDVQEVARCFTGWTIMLPRGGKEPGNEDAGKFYFNPRLHDNGEKAVLGHKISAGGGMNDGLQVLDILAHHPSTAKFIATKLCRNFISDAPSPALVSRIAEVFQKSDGNISDTLRAIFYSPEFNSVEAYRAKIKTPLALAVSSIRVLGGDTNGGPGLHQWIAKMGEPLYQYQAPTGYPNTAEAWVNTGALLERLNFALALAGNRIPGTRLDPARFASDQPTGREQVLEEFTGAILQGDISTKTRAGILKKLEQGNSNSGVVLPAATAEPIGKLRLKQREMGTSTTPEKVMVAALVLGSPEFQRH